MEKKYCIDCGKEVSYISTARCHQCANEITTKNLSLAWCKKQKIQRLLQSNLISYYWMGFLMADGTITDNKRLRLCLGYKDKEHLKKFCKYIKSVYKKYKTYVYTSVQNKNIINKIMKKFNWKSNKTVNSPKKLNIKNNNLFISFLIGYIDGDGCIKKQYNRKDCVLSIKVHKNWKNILNKWVYRIYKICHIKKINNLIRINNFVKINKMGYAIVNIANSRILSYLKIFIIQNKLPVLYRKWKKIPINYSRRYSNSYILKKKLLKLRNQGLSPKEISKKCNVGESYICKITKKRHIRPAGGK